MTMGPKIRLITTVTCPVCDFPAQEAMPIGESIQYYQCMECGSLLTPEPGDCCVFCSYGDVRCPDARRTEGPVPE